MLSIVLTFLLVTWAIYTYTKRITETITLAHNAYDTKVVQTVKKPFNSNTLKEDLNYMYKKAPEKQQAI